LGLCKRQAVLNYHPLRFTLRQRASGSEAHQPHRDNSVGIAYGLRELKISRWTKKLRLRRGAAVSEAESRFAAERALCTGALMLAWPLAELNSFFQPHERPRKSISRRRIFVQCNFARFVSSSQNWINRGAP
jgi:hypothetical protein